MPTSDAGSQTTIMGDVVDLDDHLRQVAQAQAGAQRILGAIQRGKSMRGNVGGASFANLVSPAMRHGSVYGGPPRGVNGSAAVRAASPATGGPALGAVVSGSFMGSSSFGQHSIHSFAPDPVKLETPPDAARFGGSAEPSSLHLSPRPSPQRADSRRGGGPAESPNLLNGLTAMLQQFTGRTMCDLSVPSRPILPSASRVPPNFNLPDTAMEASVGPHSGVAGGDASAAVPCDITAIVDALCEAAHVPHPGATWSTGATGASLELPGRAAAPFPQFTVDDHGEAGSNGTSFNASRTGGGSTGRGDAMLRLDAAGEDAYLAQRRNPQPSVPIRTNQRRASGLVTQSSADFESIAATSDAGMGGGDLDSPAATPMRHAPGANSTAAPSDLSAPRGPPRDGSGTAAPSALLAAPLPSITPATPYDTLVGGQAPQPTALADAKRRRAQASSAPGTPSDGVDRTPRGLIAALVQLIVDGGWNAAPREGSMNRLPHAFGGHLPPSPAASGQSFWSPFSESPKHNQHGRNSIAAAGGAGDEFLARMLEHQKGQKQARRMSSSGTSSYSLGRPGGRDSVVSMAGGSRPTAQLTTDAILGDEDFDGTSTINQYVLLSSIGRGGQGEVMLAMDTNTNELRAIKVVSRPRATIPSAADVAEFPAGGGASGSASGGGSGEPIVGGVRSTLRHIRNHKQQQLQREIAAMKRCRHRNIVALYEVIDDPGVHSLYLVMQYVDHGSLVSMRRDGTPSRTIAPDVLAGYARQLCAGLLYLHNHGIVHRDIKPDNILLGADDVVFLSDFGVSDVVELGNGPQVVNGTRGTHVFLAPELLDSSASRPAGTQGPAVDVWALGLTFYVLLYGRLPWEFHPARILDYFEAVGSEEITFPTVAADGATPVARTWVDLLRGMLARNPLDRITLTAARAQVKTICAAADASRGIAPDEDDASAAITDGVLLRNAFHPMGLPEPSRHDSTPIPASGPGAARLSSLGASRTVGSSSRLLQRFATQTPATMERPAATASVTSPPGSGRPIKAHRSLPLLPVDATGAPAAKSRMALPPAATGEDSGATSAHAPRPTPAEGAVEESPLDDSPSYVPKH